MALAFPQGHTVLRIAVSSFGGFDCNTYEFHVDNDDVLSPQSCGTKLPLSPTAQLLSLQS